MANYSARKYFQPGLLYVVVFIMTLVSIVLRLVVVGLEAFQLADTRDTFDSFQTQMMIERARILITVFTSFWNCLALFFTLKLMGRFNHNAWSFGPTGMRYTPGWTMVWFLIPIAHLIYPFLSIQETWRVSQRGEGSWQSRAGNRMVNAWWGLSVAAFPTAFVFGDAKQMSIGRFDVEYIQIIAGLYLLAKVLIVSLDGLFLVVIHQLSAAQQTRQSSGERYDRETEACSGCGEPITLRLGHCPVCGKSLEIETLEPA